MAIRCLGSCANSRSFSKNRNRRKIEKEKKEKTLFPPRITKIEER